MLNISTLTDAAGVERKKPAEINTVEGSVTVQVADASSNAQQVGTGKPL